MRRIIDSGMPARSRRGAVDPPSARRRRRPSSFVVAAARRRAANGSSCRARRSATAGSCERGGVGIAEGQDSLIVNPLSLMALENEQGNHALMSLVHAANQMVPVWQACHPRAFSRFGGTVVNAPASLIKVPVAENKRYRSGFAVRLIDKMMSLLTGRPLTSPGWYLALKKRCTTDPSTSRRIEDLMTLTDVGRPSRSRNICNSKSP